MDGFKMTFGFSGNSSEAQCEQGDEGTILVCVPLMSLCGHLC